MNPPVAERGLRVLIAGDSTAAPYVATAFPMCGWGAHLGAPLNAALAGAGSGEVALPLHVVDLAKNGSTTESHREDGLWDAVLASTGPGDVVVIQFGHNDEKREHLDPWDGYTANLRRMIAEVRERGAYPVLATPVARRNFVDGALVDTHGDYPVAARALATELDLPLLDLTVLTAHLLADLGEERSRELFTHVLAGTSPFYPEGKEDDTHFAIDGAIAVAEIAARELAPIVAGVR
jgi:lysophospholipase L1-like esterase